MEPSLSPFFSPAVLWFAGAVLLFLLELFLPGFIVFYFGTGALAVFLWLKFIGDISITAQLSIWFSVSLLLMLLTRRMLMLKFFQDKDKKSADVVDEFIGYEVTALSDVSAGGKGRVKFRGTEWTAVFDGDASAGSVWVVRSIDGSVLYVTSK
jgi:membrane protein implicated in regulation of membrane protease activity